MPLTYLTVRGADVDWVRLRAARLPSVMHVPTIPLDTALRLGVLSTLADAIRSLSVCQSGGPSAW